MKNTNNPSTPKYITLASGQPSREVPTTKLGQPSSLFLTPGEHYAVLPDDSRDDGVGETLAARLVEESICVYVPTQAPTAALPDASPNPPAPSTSTE